MTTKHISNKRATDLRHDLNLLDKVSELADVNCVLVELNQLADEMINVVDEISDTAIRDVEMESADPEVRAQVCRVLTDQKEFVRQWMQDFLRRRGIK